MPVTAIRKKAPKEPHMTAEIPRTLTESAQSAAEIARQSVDQAQAAFEKASDMAHDGVQMFDAAAGALKTNAAEFQLKAMEIAQANTNAMFQHVRNLLSLGGPAEIVPLTQTFLSDQMQAFVRQTAEINDLAAKLAAETAKPVHEGLVRSFDGWRKAFNA